ncbi:acyl-CoA thioesterase-1 [Catalinimonas alkaloidigena]|uniref:Acyl-CoA thioesterase-1 n=1 Tax=Catalinimonas alkaloidigena TaxID=1075417 RepID=A0A1G9QKQ8_9BACT|nr:arylesterase [Catalinimonas alkaloidigena]SDM11441.1 acyl-CoA thioesterase-1 [Catalinimonas alkaloidigena]
MKTILCFGDSLTAGYGVKHDESYPALIQQKLDQRGWAVRVVNAGLSGDTTQGGLSRLAYWLQQPFDIFVLELGINDLFRAVPPAQIQANLQTIISRVKVAQPQARQLLVGMEAPLAGLTLPVVVPQVDAFHRLFRYLAEDNALPLVPFLLRGVAGQPHLNLMDRLHPNAAGYQRVAETVWEELEKIVLPLVSACEPKR